MEIGKLTAVILPATIMVMMGKGVLSLMPRTVSKIGEVFRRDKVTIVVKEVKVPKSYITSSRHLFECYIHST